MFKYESYEIASIRIDAYFKQSTSEFFNQSGYCCNPQQQFYCGHRKHEFID